MDKHFLNAEYPDLYQGGTRPGRYKQVVLKLKRGDGQKPTVLWDIISHSEDAPYLADPIIELVGTNDEETKLYYEIKLPNVGGVEYIVKCRVGAKGREKTVAKFQTWRRIMLSAECPNKECYKAFKTALTRVQKALKPAFIEVIRGGVKIEGEDDYRHELPDNDLGCGINVTFTLPRWEKYGQKFELSVTSDEVTGHSRWTKRDNLLIFDLPQEHDVIRPQIPGHQNVQYIQAIAVTCEGETLLAMPSHFGFFPEHETSAYLQLCKIRKDGEIVEDEPDVHTATDMILDLDSEPLQATNAALEAGKTVELSVTLGLELWGRSAGAAIQNQQAFRLTYYPHTTAKELVSVLTHELAHTMYLVKQQETRKDDGEVVDNPTYHGNDYGGNGPHCSFNARKVETGATTSGYTYEYDNTAGPLCTMHFKTDPGIDEGKYCPNCIGQLRRAKLPGEKRDPIDP
jgi:hypothetical protein